MDFILSNGVSMRVINNEVQFAREGNSQATVLQSNIVVSSVSMISVEEATNEEENETLIWGFGSQRGELW
jgi:hypothetical protein